MFGDFAEKKLPKDDLYYSIKTEMESNEKAVGKKKKKEAKNTGANILPPVQENKMGEINAEQDKLEKERILQDMKDHPENYPDQSKAEKANLVE